MGLQLRGIIIDIWLYEKADSFLDFPLSFFWIISKRLYGIFKCILQSQIHQLEFFSRKILNHLNSMSKKKLPSDSFTYLQFFPPHEDNLNQFNDYEDIKYYSKVSKESKIRCRIVLGYFYGDICGYCLII